MKKAIEFLLFNSGVSNYQIAKATGISQVVLSKYATGKSDVGRMTLDNAEKIYNYFKEWIEMTENEFGTVFFEGKGYILVEQAFLNHIQGLDGVSDDHYAARAVDRDGNEYMVYWNPVDGWERLEDASEHCDWDSPVEVTEL